MHNHTTKDHDHTSNAVANNLVQKKAENTMPAPNRTGMPDNLKAGIETLSGMDMSNVQVHFNSAKPAQLHALAYAQGNDIHVGAGQEKHLPHEAWHVVQQRQGRVQPTVQVKGNAVNDSPSLEAEADTMGAAAVQMKAYKPPVVQHGTTAGNAIQLVMYRSKTDHGLTFETTTNAGGAFAQAPGYKESSLPFSAFHYMDATSAKTTGTTVPMATQTNTMVSFPERHGIGSAIAKAAMVSLSGQGITYFQPDIMKSSKGNAMAGLINGTKKTGPEMEAILNKAAGINVPQQAGCWSRFVNWLCGCCRKKGKKQPLINKDIEQGGFEGYTEFKEAEVEKGGELPPIRTYPAIQVDYDATNGSLNGKINAKLDIIG